MTPLRSIRVLSSVFPTRDDPTKGLPIWHTLSAFPHEFDLVAYCSLPWRPEFIGRLMPPRTYLRYPAPVDVSASAFRAVSLPYFSVPGIGARWNGIWLSRALTARIHTHPPQVILGYRIYPDGYAAVRAARRLRIASVICSRGSDLNALPPSGPVREQTIYALRHADAVLGVSSGLVQTSIKLGAPEHKTFLVRNGIDRSIFRIQDRAAARSALNVPADARLILFVGNLLPVKRTADLLDAAANLTGAFSTLRVAVIGEGNLEPDLRGQAETLGISARVSFLGALPASAVAFWMAAANLLCIPSASEGMPNVVLEAFSCGIPVIGSAVGGIPELINQDCGILFPAQDKDALAGALARALNTDWNPILISSSKIDSWDSVACRTLDICQRTIQP